MTKKQLLEEITADPARYFRTPNDVNRDRRFNDHERLQILQAWERDARALSVAADEGMTGGEQSRLDAVVAARLEVEKKLPLDSDYHESSKYGGGTTQ
jgi:hypothetical protein